MVYTYLVYISVLIFSSICAYCVSRSRNYETEFFFRMATFLCMFLPAALRYGIGTDYFNYIDILNSRTLNSNIEWAYRMMNDIIRYLNLDIQWIFIISSFLIYIPICFLVKKNKIFIYVLFFILLVYLRSYNIIRQAIAISFVLCAFSHYIENRKNIVLIIGALFASTFHFSALLILPLILFLKIRFNKSFILIFLVILMVLVINGNLIYLIFTSDIFLNSGYGNYAFSEYNRETEVGSGLGILLQLAVPFIVIINKKNNENYSMMILLSSIYILAKVFSTQIYIFNRLLDAVIFIPVLLAGYIFECKNRKLLLLFFCICLLNYLLSINIGQSSKYSGIGVSPYVSIFDKN